MRTEYDFSEAVTGAHYRVYDRGTNVVLLDPDVAAVFKDSEAVNPRCARWRGSRKPMREANANYVHRIMSIGTWLDDWIRYRHDTCPISSHARASYLGYIFIFKRILSLFSAIWRIFELSMPINFRKYS